ncbi:MAG: aldo/keto reductase [Anaerolineales bacterium]|nr:aldo/keto reductase [Anaerolineales bacterium]MCK5634758.1 aldo/keto reductase [Anaerolineales bacterium]
MTLIESVRKRRLGQTDIYVTPIGLGVMQFAGGAGIFGMMFPEISQEEMNRIIKTALDGGINWSDTAEVYGRGRSERGLANGLRAAAIKDDEIIIATKWFPMFRTARNIPRTINHRLHFLDGYSIDHYIVHQPWGFSPPEAEMEAMADLVQAGKVRSVGVSNFNAEQMRRAHKALQKRGLPLAANQVQYSLLHRKIETNGVLDAAKELGVTITAWSPLASGLLTGKFHKDPEILSQIPFGRRIQLRREIERSRPLIQALEEMASENGATPAQIALNWLIHFHGDTVVAIPGASRVKQAEENAAVMKFRLSDADMARLDEQSNEFR